MDRACNSWGGGGGVGVRNKDDSKKIGLLRQRNFSVSPNVAYATGIELKRGLERKKEKKCKFLKIIRYYGKHTVFIILQILNYVKNVRFAQNKLQ